MDKLPPHSPEAEMSIIGCCLIEPKRCLPEAQAVITSPDWFYDIRCQIVWSAMTGMELHQVDAVLMRQYLRDTEQLKQVSAEFISECMDMVPSTWQLPVWVEELKHKQTLRRVISACTQAIQSAYQTTGDSTALLDDVERSILAIRPNQSQDEDIKALVKQAIDEIELRCNNQGKISGLETGLVDLDKLTDGLHVGEMIVLAAWPSLGKTGLAVNMAVHNAIAGVPVAIFSAEMRPVQLVVRSICSESRTNFLKVTNGDIAGMFIACNKLAYAPLYIQQANRMSIGQVTAMARRLKQKHGIKLIVVDYIQLLTGTGDNREQEISSISKGIKAMALELDVAVLALSQLTDEGKLRESRAIGQDADSIWKLDNDGEWKPLIQPVTLKVDKCRNGSTGVVNLTFLKEFTRFENASKISEGDVPNELHTRARTNGSVPA